MADKVYEQVGDYIPRRDEGFDEWLRAFARNIRCVAPDPADLGLTEQDVEQIDHWAGQFHEAYRASTMPARRTSGTVHQRRALRRTVESMFRGFAQRIKHHPGVTQQQMVELGIHLDDPGRMPIGAPASAPLLHVAFTSWGGHRLQFADENTPTRRAKPPGVALIQIYANVGPGPDENSHRARPLVDSGRQPIRIDWPPEQAGLTATFFGRWMTRRGLKGPWSLPVSLMIAGNVARIADRGAGYNRRHGAAA